MSREEITETVLQLERRLKQVEKRINEGLKRNTDIIKGMRILKKQIDCLAEVLVAEEPEVFYMN